MYTISAPCIYIEIYRRRLTNGDPHGWTDGSYQHTIKRRVQLEDGRIKNWFLMQQYVTEIFCYTTIAIRLWAISWNDKGNQTVVINLIYGSNPITFHKFRAKDRIQCKKCHYSIYTYIIRK